jgi:hypothetical protein
MMSRGTLSFFNLFKVKVFYFNQLLQKFQIKILIICIFIKQISFKKLVI